MANKESWYKRNPEKAREYKRKRYSANKEIILKKNKEWTFANKAKVKSTKYKWNLNNLLLRRAYTLKSLLKLKMEVFRHYSKEIPECACCKETEMKFLAIDHINGGGGKERRETKSKGGQKTYRLLRKNKYPTGYQVLCHNCNMAKGFYGKCPHNALLEGIQ